MSAPPYMPLFVADYLGDTRHLSTEQHGAYLLLLMAMWRAGGTLPNDAAKLARMAGLTAKKWATTGPEVLSFFAVSGDQITHGRVTKELEKYLRRAEVNSISGSLGGRAKSRKTKETDLASATISLQRNPTNQNQNQKEDKTPTSEKAETQQNGQAVRRACRLPVDWYPSAELVIYAIQQGLNDVEAERAGEDFRDYWSAKTGADATKLDWVATWRRWVREEVKRKNRRVVALPQKRVGWV